MGDYRVDVKVRNNNILKIIESRGYVSPLDFTKKTGFSYGSLMNLINLKKSPLQYDGEFRPTASLLAEILDCMIEELFSSAQLECALESNKRTFEVQEAEMMFMLQNQPEQKLLEDIICEEKVLDEIEKQLDTLTPREKKIIELRFGLNGNDTHTLEQCSQRFDVNRERIRQIEAKALRKLRHPFRTQGLRDLIEDFS